MINTKGEKKMKIYTINTNEGTRDIYISSDTISEAIALSDNDILQFYFDIECNIIFEKHYKSWKSRNIATGKLDRKYIELREEQKKQHKNFTCEH